MAGVTIMNNEILEEELTQKNYKLENLQDHITNFVKIQYKNTTKNNYEKALTKFYNYLKDNEIKVLTLNNANRIVKQYKSYLTESTQLASTSIDTYIRITRAFLNSYLDLKVKKIKKLNNSKPSPKYIELEEVQGLINTVQYITGNLEQITRDKAIIGTLFTGGLRISELLNIKLSDYFTKNNISYLRVIGKGKSEDTPEVIRIPDQTASLINDYLKQRRIHKRNCKYLFCNSQDKQMTRQAVNKEVKKIANEYDKLNNTNIAPRVSTHTFRHSIARYLLVDKGESINKVKDFLRHSNIETTAKYLTTSEEEIQDLRGSLTIL